MIAQSSRASVGARERADDPPARDRRRELRVLRAPRGEPGRDRPRRVAAVARGRGEQRHRPDRGPGGRGAGPRALVGADRAGRQPGLRRRHERGCGPGARGRVLTAPPPQPGRRHRGVVDRGPGGAGGRGAADAGLAAARLARRPHAGTPGAGSISGRASPSCGRTTSRRDPIGGWRAPACSWTGERGSSWGASTSATSSTGRTWS